MTKTFSFFILLLSIFALPFTSAVAMELTAGQQSADSALSGFRNSVESKLVLTEIKKVITCHQKLSFYAPQDSKADADGCVEVSLDLPNCSAGQIVVSTGSGWRCE